jgi:hypothetical protein
VQGLQFVRVRGSLRPVEQLEGHLGRRHDHHGRAVPRTAPAGPARKALFYIGLTGMTAMLVALGFLFRAGASS